MEAISGQQLALSLADLSAICGIGEIPIISALIVCAIAACGFSSLQHRRPRWTSGLGEAKVSAEES